MQAQTAPATASAPTTGTTATTPATTPVVTTPAVVDTTPAVTAQNAPASGNSGAPHTGFNVSHYPIIDIIPIYTAESLQYSQPGRSWDYLDIGGTVKIPISTRLSVAFDRLVGGTLNTAPERTLSPTTGAPTFNAESRDVVLVYRADWQFSPNWLLEGGFQFRHRAYAGCEPTAANAPDCSLSATSVSSNSGISSVPFPYTNSSTEAHWGYLGLTYTTPPIQALKNVQFAFNFTGDDQRMDPNVAVLCTSATTQLPYPGSAAHPCTGHVHQIILVPEDDLQTNGTPYLNQQSYLESTQYVAAIVPFTHGITGVVNYTWGALNFYENQEFPWRWSSAMTYTLTDKFNPFVAFTLRWKNLHEDPQNIPYACGPVPGCTNTVHVGDFDAYFTFHVDTGAWFH
ncbi:MAG: hypothetical protein ABR975_04950 [Vulcanimicrobiaceae bacterium]